MSAKLTTLAPPGGDPAAANALATPTAVSPKSRQLQWTNGGLEALSWPAMSVSVLVLKRE